MAPTLRQLEYFVTVGRRGIVHRGCRPAPCEASRACPTRSSPWNATLGGPLLERLPRDVRLTPAPAEAHCLTLEPASPTPSAPPAPPDGPPEWTPANCMSARSTRSASACCPKHCIGCVTTTPTSRFASSSSGGTGDLIAAMEAGQADLAVGPTPPGWTGPVQAIGVEEFVIAAAPGATLPTKGSTVRLADLATQQWVHFTPRAASPTSSTTRAAQRDSNPRSGPYRASPLGPHPGPGGPRPDPRARQCGPARLSRTTAVAGPTRATASYRSTPAYVPIRSPLPSWQRSPRSRSPRPRTFWNAFSPHEDSPPSRSR